MLLQAAGIERSERSQPRRETNSSPRPPARTRRLSVRRVPDIHRLGEILAQPGIVALAITAQVTILRYLASINLERGDGRLRKESVNRLRMIGPVPRSRYACPLLLELWEVLDRALNRRHQLVGVNRM